MTKAERLARRLHQLSNEHWEKHPRDSFMLVSWHELKPAIRAGYRAVARGLLRDQAKERRKK